MNSHERMGLIQSAKNVFDGDFDAEVRTLNGSPGKFEHIHSLDKDIGLAAYVVWMSGFADAEASQAAAVGSVVVMEDNYGFVHIGARYTPDSAVDFIENLAADDC